MRPTKTILSISLWGGCFALLLLMSCQLFGLGPGQKETYQGIPLDKPSLWPDVELVTHEGLPFRFRDLQTETAILYFGYTFCPDICPMTLGAITQVLETLEQNPDVDVSQLKVVFISVDPERDTPTVLSRYVTSFNPHYLGLTGDVTAIEAARQPFQAFAEKTKVGGSRVGYLVNHTTRTYLISPKIKTILQYPLDFDPDDLSHDILKILRSKGHLPSPKVSGAWIRPAFEGGNSAIYFNITAQSDAADRLLRVETDVAEGVEIHQTTIENEVMKMALVTEGVTIAEGENVIFEPSGLHVMLIGLQADLTQGQIIPITLHFEKAGLIQIEAEVQAQAKGAENHQHNH